MWIYKNYFSIKELQAAVAKVHEMATKTEENDIKMDDEVVEVLDSNRHALEMSLKKAELEYDRTLYTILYNLQQRQDQKDL
jgi:hypothetical protein